MFLLICRHYRQAYNHLLEIEKSEPHLLEFKVVAGLINFKVLSCYSVTISFIINDFKCINFRDRFAAFPLKCMPQMQSHNFDVI